MNARVLIASDYNSKEIAHNALSYEMCQVIAQCEDADLIAPHIDNYIERNLGRILPPHDEFNVQRDFNRLVNGVRKSLGMKNAPTVAPVELDKAYDLFVYVAWTAASLVQISRVKNWRQRCSKAIIFMHELWLSTLKDNQAYLKILDQFDHVFLLHQASISALQKYTSTPCSFMPTGSDCLMATPYPFPPERVIDVYSMGNRPAVLHKKLVELAEKQEIFYLYDSLSSSDSRMKDWHEHRLLVANNIKRSRYFVAFNPAAIATSKASLVQDEQVIPARFFEGAAGGSVIIGEAPKCPEFKELFDWPDAVINVPANCSDIRSLLKELDAQHTRMERIRHDNAISSLRRHDWIYRWESMLKTIGMEVSPKAHERKDRLHAIADAAEAAARGTWKTLGTGTR